ncbi:MAG: hypothetical protein CL663_01610 [Bacteroidetes bacterium]|nr:hypothetical protein [Bacteroidota bacterium]
MSSNSIKLYSYIDKALFKAGSHQSEFKKDYVLSIQIALDGFSFCILDTEKNKHLALETYRIQEIVNYTLLADELNTIIDRIDVIKRRFSKVLVLFEGEKSSLVPTPLFEETKLPDYLKFHYKLDTDEEVMSNHLQNLDAYNVFSIPFKIKELIKSKFINTKFCHQSTTLIESLLVKLKNQQSGNTVFINYRESSFDIIYLKNGKMHFYNSFHYRTAEDFVYFIIFTLEQLKLNPETIDLCLLGEIDKSSKYYQLLYKYVRNIRFIERNDFYTYSYVLDNIPSNHFYNLFNASSCEL